MNDRIDGDHDRQRYAPYHQRAADGSPRSSDAQRRQLLGRLPRRHDVVRSTRSTPWRVEWGFSTWASSVPPPPQLANYLRVGDWWTVGQGQIRRATPALDWLDGNLCRPKVCLCWGDAGCRRALQQRLPTSVAALDWEMSYLGDPGR